LKNPTVPTFALIAVVALFLSACASAQPTQTPVPGAGRSGVTATDVPASGPTQEPLAALVNDKPITISELDGTVQRRLEGIRSVGDPLPADATAYRVSVLDALIEQMLIEQAADIQGIKVTDADVDAEVQANINIAGGQDKWLTRLAADHMTEAEYRAALRSALITQKMRDIVTASIPATAEQAHARHILVATEATANEIEGKLKAGGDFAELAAQYSLDMTTKQTGGDLGWFSRGQLLQKAVEDAAFSLAINEISAPVKSDLGYHIIQTLERVKDRPIDAETHYRLAEDAFERWIQSLKKNARIVKFPSGRTG
jgi:parvulin-like peptidyl-prolyl isomerase